jgi:hypothetical protein
MRVIAPARGTAWRCRLDNRFADGSVTEGLMASDVVGADIDLAGRADPRGHAEIQLSRTGPHRVYRVFRKPTMRRSRSVAPRQPGR